MAGGTSTCETRMEKFLTPSSLRAPDRHGVGWGGGFKTDSEKHHFLIRVCPSDFQTVERRIDDAHIRAL